MLSRKSLVVFRELATLLPSPFQLFFFNTYFSILCVCVPKCMHAHIRAGSGGRKVASDPLEPVTNSCELPDVGLGTSGSFLRAAGAHSC